MGIRLHSYKSLLSVSNYCMNHYGKYKIDMSIIFWDLLIKKHGFMREWLLTYIMCICINVLIMICLLMQLPVAFKVKKQDKQGWQHP